MNEVSVKTVLDAAEANHNRLVKAVMKEISLFHHMNHVAKYTGREYWRINERFWLRVNEMYLYKQDEFYEFEAVRLEDLQVDLLCGLAKDVRSVVSNILRVIQAGIV